MNKLRNLLSAAAMSLALAGCASMGATPTGAPPTVGTVQADAVKAAKAVVTLYADLYQPAVLAYGRLPDCPGATLCKDRAILNRLKAADLVASTAIEKARPILDGLASGSGIEIQDAVKGVQAAESLVASSGAFNLMKGTTP